LDDLVHGGIIRLIETKLNRPLQWDVCLLHANELPFRDLFPSVDGCTTGPNTCEGSIGAEIRSKNHLQDLELVEFQRIPGKVLQITDPQVVGDLSYEQKYLLHMSLSIQCGDMIESNFIKDQLVHWTMRDG